VFNQAKGDLSTELFYDNLKEKAAQRITSQIINGVFPIKIVGVEGQTVFLNYGKGAAQFSVGDELDVYQTGEDMIDPDSGDSLGPKERYLGKIKVKAIERKKSIAVITGLGYTFIHDSITAKIAKFLYKVSLKHAQEVWFINTEDRNKFLLESLVPEEKMNFLPSEGINVETFSPLEIKREDNIFRFILIARLLWDKGVGEYVKAAKILTSKFIAKV